MTYEVTIDEDASDFISYSKDTHSLTINEDQAALMKVGTYRINYKAITEDGYESQTAVMTIVVRSRHNQKMHEWGWHNTQKWKSFLSDENLQMLNQMRDTILRSFGNFDAKDSSATPIHDNPIVKIADVTLDSLVKVRFSEEIVLLSQQSETSIDESENESNQDIEDE